MLAQGITGMAHMLCLSIRLHYHNISGTLNTKFCNNKVWSFLKKVQIFWSKRFFWTALVNIALEILAEILQED